MNTPPTSDRLDRLLLEFKLPVTAQQAARLDRYCQLVWELNRQINLTRHDNYRLFITRDLVDTLQLAALLSEGEKVMDIGTGGGVPGVVLSILRADLQITLCESVGKRFEALRRICAQLGLSATLIHGRAEQVLEEARFDACVARAVGPLWRLCSWLRPHWPAAGRLLAIKGPKWIEERREARQRGVLNNVQLRCAARYLTPGCDVENVILKLWAKGAPEK